MTTNDTTGAASDDAVAALASLKAKTETYLEEIKAEQREWDDIAQLPETTAVTAVLDADGRLISLEIDPETRGSLDGDALNVDINVALAHATRNKPQPDVAEVAHAAENNPAGLDLAGLLEQVFAGSTGDLPTEPEVFWNDLHTVGARVMWGALQEIICAPAWLSAASPSSISVEIIRVAGLAMDAEKASREGGN